MGKRVKTGGGSRKGIPNKSTADVRACIALIAERNVAKLEAWIAEIEDPAKRAGLLLDLFEYHLPKLARTEITGKDGKELPLAQLTVIDMSL